MTGKVNHECAAQIVADAFVRQQQHHVEQIARVLPVERGDQLAAVEIGKGDDRHDDEAPERRFHRLRDGAHIRRIDRTAQNGIRFDLYLRGACLDDQLGRVGAARADYARAGDHFLGVVGDPGERRCDIGERFRPRFEREIDKIDIYREPGQIPHEKIDRRPALERKSRLLRDEGQDLQQQIDLGEVGRILHAGSPA